MIIIKYCMYVCCWNKFGNVHCSFNFIFFNPICEKTRNNTLLFFFVCFSKPLDLSLTKFKKKSKYTLWTKFKVKAKVNPINNAPVSNLMTDLESLYNFLSEYMF